MNELLLLVSVEGCDEVSLEELEDLFSQTLWDTLEGWPFDPIQATRPDVLSLSVPADGETRGLGQRVRELVRKEWPNGWSRRGSGGDLNNL